MIGFLSGTIHTKLKDQLILLTGGVGYLVSLPPSSIETFKQSRPIALFIYTHIREDTFDLYGFRRIAELNLFKLILSVSGIGPKTALMVVDRGVDQAEQAIKNADTDFFSLIPRLGRKNAQKIIIELKNKLGGLKELDLTKEGEINSQAIEALRSMGYSKQEALKTIQQVPESELTLERKISFALKSLGKSKLE